ncbi:MAG: hypothetical protein ACRC1K_18845 [Planctomycetia bacterium]
MRNIIFGSIGLVWGGLLVMNSLFREVPQHGGARGAGQAAGQIFAYLLIAAGAYAMRTGLQSLGTSDGKRKKKKKKKPAPTADE